MSELDVEVLKPSLRDADGPNAITLGAVARLRRLDGAVRDDSRSIALGVGTAPQRINDLDAGTYEIRLMLPSGQVITQQVELPPIGVGHVSFNIDAAPNPVLTWQQYGGQIALPVSRSLRSFVPPVSESIPDVSRLATHLEEYRGPSGQGGSVGDVDLLMINVQPANDDPVIDDARVCETWELLSRGVRGDATPAEMVRGFFKRLVRPVDMDEFHQSWGFRLPSANEPGKRPARPYAVVRGGDFTELVSLPSPWRIDIDEQEWSGETIVDLLVDKTPSRRGVRSSVVVRDSGYGGLIAYMGTGAIGLAGEMIRASRELETVALDMLGAKSKSPLGACAAAYVLLATREWAAEGDSEPSWVQWVHNLDADPLYNWIPDAAILCARMVLQRAESREEALAAIPYLHRALRNGLPFYGLGYRWLLEAMRFCRHDALIERVFPHVDKVSRYIDTSQTFIALQLDPPR